MITVYTIIAHHALQIGHCVFHSEVGEGPPPLNKSDPSRSRSSDDDDNADQYMCVDDEIEM